MRTHQIQARLRKLEARTRSWPTKEGKLLRFLTFVWVASAAYYLDELQTDEPISFTCAFDSDEEFQNASPETQEALIKSKVDQLLAKFGVTQNDKLDKLSEASKQMLAGLSEPYKKRLQYFVREAKVEWPIEFAEPAPGVASDPHGQ
jgi:hypothetical protein